MTLRVSSVVLLLLITTMMSACGVFSRREVPYHDAHNQPPLQVPADLSRPPVDDALRIPELSAEASRRGAAAPAARSRVGGPTMTTLVLDDSVDSVWRRVGLALERMGDNVQILDADQAAGRYQVSMTGAQPAQGMFRRMFKREQRVQEQFNLVVEPGTEGTVVRVEGGAVLARDLLQRLSSRLG